jgi:hypothetical protein
MGAKPLLISVEKLTPDRLPLGEEVLHENHAGRVDAIEWLLDVPAEAVAAVGDGQPVPRHGADPSRFEYLLPWGTLNEVLEAHRAWPTRMAVVRAGQTVSTAKYLETIPGRERAPQERLRVNSERLQRHLADGATLVFGSIDETVPAVRHLAERLELQLGAEVSVNLYAAWGAVEGFAPHWDDHDTLILQVYGRKEWRIYGPGWVAPLPGDRARNQCPPEPVEQFVLEPGQALYVPRGWWHGVRPMGAETVHLTYGIWRPTWLSFLQFLVDTLSEHEQLRGDLPRAVTGRAWPALGVARDILAGRVGEQDADRYLAYLDGLARPRPRLALPLGAQPATLATAEVELRAPRTLRAFASGEEVQVPACGRLFRLHADTLPALRALTGRAPVPAATLAEACGRGEHDPEWLRCLEGLATEGLITPAPDSSLGASADGQDSAVRSWMAASSR